MAENNVGAEHDWSDWALDAAEDTVVAMETLLATLRAFEDVLRQQEISTASSTEYCDNFCQALMHYAGSRNSIEHGLPLLEVYCLSINCFAAARSHLSAESESVGLVLKRLALSCFELLLSVPENEIPYEAWLQFHHSVQLAHDTLIQYGSTDLQALLQITGEGGAWSNPILSALLTGQSTSPDDVNAYISLEGEGFMEMRVKHLEKMGEVAKAGVLAKACAECSLISNQGMFRQIYVSQLCHLLPNEEAIMEISRLDCKDVLDVTRSLETDGEENTAFILCTTFLTQQLQQQSLYCSWELISLWSKLQKRLDPSLMSLLERCLQLGAIAKTVQHLLYLVRVIQAEAEEVGVNASVELCVKALQLPKQDDSETRTSICKMVSSLLPRDLEVLRACQLTEFLLSTSQEAFTCLKELYLRPDQKRDQEGEVISNSLRCELLLALKAYWPFDPEFWDWKTLKYHCVSLLGLRPESEEDEEEEEDDEEEEEEEVEDKQEKAKLHEPQGGPIKVEPEPHGRMNGGFAVDKNQINNHGGVNGKTRRPKLRCQICKRSVSEAQLVHHSKKHAEKNNHPCPVCLEDFRSRKDLVAHMKKHLHRPPPPPSRSGEQTADTQKQPDGDDDDDVEPGEITLDPSLMLYYKSTHDPDVLHHLVEQAQSAKEAQEDDDEEHVTFDYIDKHFKLQNREVYPCPGTRCARVFKHSKYLYVHLKSEHKGDDNVKHFHQMRDKREKCVFCRRHFVSAYHHRKHRKVHYGDRPYMCVVTGCGARFGTSNELVMHKHTHGFQLNYRCELKGCGVTYSDLGQIYHHEAQHFRDAAFTCSAADCKKFFLSKKDFLRHLSTHSITFEENDFEAQRRAKRKLFKAVREAAAAARPAKPADAREAVNGDLLHAQAAVSSAPQEPEHQEPEATVTLVAVCFDGSKFTCGFEKCGMTFSRARDVQRHLKCAHPEHLKLENREQKQEKEEKEEKNPLPAEIKAEMEAESEEQEPPSPASPAEPAPPPAAVDETGSEGPNTKSDALMEILIGLSKLSLSAASSSLSAQNKSPTQPKPNLKGPQTSLHQAIIAKPPVVLLKKRPPAPDGKVKAEPEERSVSAEEEDGVETLAKAKPFICEIKRCGFRTARGYSLLRHYLSVHSLSTEEAKQMISSFKPYKCHLCDKTMREKKVLKTHYLQVHNMSEEFFDKLSFEGSKGATSPTFQRAANPPERLQRRDAPKLQPQLQARRENGETGSGHSSVEGGADGAEGKEKDGEDQTAQVRTRRVVAKSNLCYILDKFSKPFHCVAKNCTAAFSTQGGLVRHLQLVHRYKRSQLLLEKDADAHRSPEARREPARRRPALNPDDPQPQFKCHFANCAASYHLKSSLARHTRDFHSRPPPLIRCKFDGCSQVFSHNEALKKHTLYSHFECYDSLVLRLQSTHKKSVTGCQKKVIVAPSAPEKGATSAPPPPAADAPESGGAAPAGKKDDGGGGSPDAKRPSGKRRNAFGDLVLRSHEEALQMCQDRCMRVSYPCMVQDCDSVVTYLHSLNRHYLGVHRVRREDLTNHKDSLVFSAEQLEELIQEKSARPPPAAAEGPPAEDEKTAELRAEAGRAEEPSSSPSPPAGDGEAPETESCEPPTLAEETKEERPPASEERIDEEPTKELTEQLTKEPPAAAEPQTTTKPEEKSILDKFKPLLRPVTVDLSPPCSLRFTSDGAKIPNSPPPPPPAPVRQPLKRKNEQPEQPLNVKESRPRSPSPNPFDIAAYKPMGFESSFLQFIQETAETETDEPPKASKHGGSVKENSQLGASPSPAVKRHAAAADFSSVQNLKSILDKALAGCGDLAVKQLQYLRPVVVLGRPVSGAATADLFPSKTNSKLLLGS